MPPEEKKNVPPTLDEGLPISPPPRRPECSRATLRRRRFGGRLLVELREQLPGVHTPAGQHGPAVEHSPFSNDLEPK